jgi:thiol-disulfide isomerase/thioredoxin
MKYAVLVGILVMGMTLLRAVPVPVKNDGAGPATASDSPPGASPAATKAWTKLKEDVDLLQKDDSRDEETVRQQVTSLLAEAHAFATRFPNDPREANATMLWTQLGGMMIKNQWAGAPSAVEINETLDRLAADNNVPESHRAEIRAMQLSRAMRLAAQDNSPAKCAAVEEKFAAFTKEFGSDYSMEGHPLIPMLREMQIKLLVSSPDVTGSRAILQKLTHDPQPEVAELAEKGLDGMKIIAGVKTKPLELKFTSVDGKKVDLAHMRGKVVLVDFWATWCGPCVEEMPTVVETYRKYHDLGLEIVGISLDQDKDALLDFTRQQEMTWPQYFDGQGWDNEISKNFGIDSVPTMWLVDKKGMLVSTDAADDLGEKVERLLKAP